MILIRAFRKSDTLDLLRIYGHEVLESIATFECEVPSFATFQKRLVTIARRFPFLVALNSEGRLAGYAYAAPHRDRIAYQWAVETSVYVRDKGQGIGQSLYKALMLQLTHRGFLWAYGVITQPNPASVALHKSCGFESFATFHAAGQKFDRWHNVLWMRKSLNTAVKNMPVPRFDPASDP